MGFWHTGYLEFAEPHEPGPFPDQAPPTYDCTECPAVFASEADLHVHRFSGHASRRPFLVFRGREAGRTRLTITEPTTVDEWSIHHADEVRLNNRPTTVKAAVAQLAKHELGVVDVELRQGTTLEEYQFEFALAAESDLVGVDAALERFIESGECSLATIDAFIERGKPFRSAKRYLDGLANYLYGVLAREKQDSLVAGREREPAYQGKYDTAVRMLGAFDRPAAEAICGMIAFHYNHFDLAMSKTNSPRVAEVALRLNATLAGRSWRTADLRMTDHPVLDRVLSDSVIEQIVTWSALPLDGSATSDFDEIAASWDSHRSYDALKLRLVSAEHLLAVGEVAAATRVADALRQSRTTDLWYSGFRRRTAKGTHS